MGKTWEQMTERERDAWVAERVMGLKVIGWATCVYGDGSPTVHPNTEPDKWSCGAWNGAVYQHMDFRPDDVQDYDETVEGVPAWALSPVPPYTTDLNHAAEAEAEIWRRGLKTDYIDNLCSVVTGRPHPYNFPSGLAELFVLATGTAAQRCEAMWRTVGGEGER